MTFSLETLLVLIVWVAPGYFFYRWISHLNPHLFRDSDVWKAAIISVPLSVIVHLSQGWLWSLIAFVIGIEWNTPSFSSLSSLTSTQSSRVVDLSSSEMVLLFSSLAITPHLLGIATGGVLQTKRSRSLLKKLSLDETSMSTTSWDSSLYFRREGEWVVITLDNGKQVGGSLGKGSEVAKSSDGGDLFLQQEWTVENGYLAEPRFASRGIWIRGDAIRSVRLIEGEEDE